MCMCECGNLFSVCVQFLHYLHEKLLKVEVTVQEVFFIFFTLYVLLESVYFLFYCL